MRGLTAGLAMLALVLPLPAWALCGMASTSNAGFGTVSSMQVQAAPQSTSTDNSGLNCTGSRLALLQPSDSFQLTVSSSTSGLVGPTGDVISYTLYANNSTSYEILRNVSFEMSRNSLLDLLGLLSSPTVAKSVPLYMSTQGGSNVAAGTYTETLSLYWNWNYCAALDTNGNCQRRDIGSGTQSLTVNMTVSNDCTISAPNLSFGTAPIASGFGTVNQILRVMCTKGSAYTVGLSDGDNPASSGGRRRMTSGTNVLPYDIFKSAGSTRWGNAGPARRPSTEAEVNPGNGLGTVYQVFTYNAKVYTDSGTPPEGTYIDHVTLDVAF